jgi:hypothetical protein
MDGVRCRLEAEERKSSLFALKISDLTTENSRLERENQQMQQFLWQQMNTQHDSSFDQQQQYWCSTPQDQSTSVNDSNRS